MKKLAYGFLDESPNLSDKNLYFCVDIISTSEETKRKLQKIIKKARRKVVKKKSKPIPEIKFYNSSKKIRTFILSELIKHDVEIIVVIIDKKGRRVKDTPENYGIVVGATIAEYLSTYSSLNLTVDKKFTNSQQQKDFLHSAQKTIDKLYKGKSSIFFNPPVDSQKDNIVKLADFVAGAFNAKYNKKDDSYVEIIKDKVKIEKKKSWTVLKKRIVKP